MSRYDQVWETRLSGKTVAITGASRGIGRELAVQLAELGVHVALGARDEEALAQLTEQMRGIRPDCRPLPLRLDVTHPASVASFAETTVREFGKVDALINCAGVGYFQNMLDLELSDFARMIEVNLTGSFLCCQQFGRHMAEAGAGHIVNIVSVAGQVGLPGCAGYSASKFGLLGLTKVMQAELRGRGVQVTAVIPGAVSSTFWEHFESTPNMDDMIPTAVLAEHLIALLGQPPGAFVDELVVMPPKGIL